MKKLIIIGLVIAIVAAVGVYLYVFHKPARLAASETAAFSVTTSTLLTEFEGDEAAANTKYLDKVIEVSGTVSTVTENETAFIVYLKEPDAASGVTCSFLKDGFDINQIKTGDKVSIKGICAGYLMDVMLNHSAIELSAKQ